MGILQCELRMKASVILSVLILTAAALGTSGCALHNTYLTWHNGEPIGERLDVNSVAECEEACKGTPDCAAWTLNTRNGWCALKSKEQIKPETKEGFESAILDDNSEFCPTQVVDGDDDTCEANRVDGIYCLNEDNEISCQTDKDCPPSSEEEYYSCSGRNVCLVTGICPGPFACAIVSFPLTISSPVAGQSFSFASDLSARLARKTQCKKKTPCRYRGNKCGRLIGRNGLAACPKRPFNF